VLPPAVACRVAVEAGIVQGWHQFIGPRGLFVGMKTFGASAPYEKIYAERGITAEAVVAAARAQG
jgi:transketolase